MINRKEYYKTFIILKPDTRGYALDNKEPSGFCKIDAYGNKAKVQVSVQNLKPISEDRGYNIYLLANCRDGVRQVLLKSFYVDEKGKRDLKFDMNRYNVEGTNLSIEEFEGVGILVEKDGYILSPLIGFKKEPFMWKVAKNNVKKETKNKESDKLEKREEKIEINPFTDKKEAQEKNDIKIEVKKETDNRNNVEIEKEEIEINKNQEIEKTKEEVKKEILVDKEIAENKKDSIIEEYFTPNKRLYNFQREKPKKEDFLKDIINKSIRMNPFEKVNEDMEWYRISYEELPLIVDYPWRWYSNPYLLVGAKKYNHLLLGKNKELNTYCLGIPDIYFPKTKEGAKRFGCNTFLCCRDIKPAPGEYGYWIINLPI
ncbi:DUF7922 domain-containing protein [Defluviitalea phaphyphila]|uniref:DUF7922 domain-containing protein n=1 Tax=Defluviitalea phaphyphila TaxID=1473580 RepID=UPI000731417A|nr:DUF6128 domain-containing protein [Defluviitalea phaphyphila]